MSGNSGIVKVWMLCALTGMGCLPVAAQGVSPSPNLSADFFDGILSEMSASSAKGADDADFYSSLKDIMAVDGTLRYLDNAFKAPAPNPQKSYGEPVRQYNYNWNYGAMALPVSGYVTSGFGYRPSFGRMHKGIDLHLAVGDTVRCALDGVVSRVDVDAHGYGLFVVVKHDAGLETRYGHLSRSLVTAGERVDAGEAIALGGSTGNSTGPHLHFETRRGGEAFDPSLMFNFACTAQPVPTKPLSRLDDANRSELESMEDLVSLVVSGKPATPQKTSPANERNTYVVKVGDTLRSIARSAGVSTLTLCRLNMLSSTDTPRPGTMLRLR